MRTNWKQDDELETIIFWMICLFDMTMLRVLLKSKNSNPVQGDLKSI